MMKSAYYVASVQFDTDDGQTADQYVYGTKIDYLVENIKYLISRRKNGELLFASYIDHNEKEHNMTAKLKESINEENKKKRSNKNVKENSQTRT
tara:strand:+ start:16964 stop:17245 length:282 start_codon:yes stop_codon:yes gene_type:complete